jgi:hypothetical protein
MVFHGEAAGESLSILKCRQCLSQNTYWLLVIHQNKVMVWINNPK